jgi:hypothetical protein
MKIEDLANALTKEIDAIMSKHNHSDRPNLAIYVERNYYQDALYEACGEIKSLSNEMYDKGTILGFPVFLTSRSRPVGQNPPMYSVIEL